MGNSTRRALPHPLVSDTRSIQPLAEHYSRVNARVTTQLRSKRRKSYHLPSALTCLHDGAGSDENAFAGQDLVDLTEWDPSKEGFHRPRPSSVICPESRCARSSPSQKTPRSSAPVPWSSSSLENHARPDTVSSPAQEQAPGRGDRCPDEETAPARTLRASPDLSSVPHAALSPTHAFERPQLQRDPSVSAARPAQHGSGGGCTAQSRLNKAPPVQDRRTQVAGAYLSDEQRDVVRAVVEQGKSVFFTGSAGTGTTLHSWAGIGLGKGSATELVRRLRGNPNARQKWVQTRVLVIDEVSMVDGQLFDKLEEIARTIRGDARPFGGIQLVVTGDFFQLPPVPERGRIANFAFDAKTWKTCVAHTILLTHVFRQKDPKFAGMLDEIRLGRLSPASVQAFQALSRPLNFDDDIDATELFPTRGEVEAANKSRMQMLSGARYTYEAIDGGVAEPRQRDNILANFMAPRTLTLKTGAQVMLIKNVDTQLVNGSLGKVTAFVDDDIFSSYNCHEPTQASAHGDGLVRDRAEVGASATSSDVASAESQGTGYSRHWPLVRFPLADGTHRDVLCQPEEWKTEGPKGEIMARRHQVPLILAWALSIHKAQGQTLSRVKVDLGRVFERGQAYVALSRATTQQGLQVSRFDATKVMVHPKVVTFYQGLVSIADMKSDAPVRQGGASDAEFSGLDDDEELLKYGW